MQHGASRAHLSQHRGEADKMIEDWTSETNIKNNFYSILLNEYTFTTYFSPKWCVQAEAQCCKKTYNWHSNSSELLPGWCNFTPVTAHIFRKSGKNRPGVVSLLVAFRLCWHARWVYSMPLWNVVPAEVKPRTHLRHRRPRQWSTSGLRLHGYRTSTAFQIWPCFPISFCRMPKPTP